MSAAKALASIAEDIDRLEAKDIAALKPNYFKRKRAEVAAIQFELDALRKELASMEMERDEAQHHLHQQQLRTGILANTLTILGFSISRHMEAPIEEADIYQDAAAMVATQRAQAPLGPNRLTYTTTKAQLCDVLTNALWWARLQHLLKPFHHLLNRYERREAA